MRSITLLTGWEKGRREGGREGEERRGEGEDEDEDDKEEEEDEEERKRERVDNQRQE